MTFILLLFLRESLILIWIFVGEEFSPNLGKISIVLYPVVVIISYLNMHENLLNDLILSMERNTADF